MIASKASSSYHNNDRDGFSRTHRDETDGGRKKTDNEGGRHIFSSKMAKLEFPRYSRDDPTEWFNQVDQFFEYQETVDNQKVSLASFYLEGEANQWWQWLHRAYKEEGRIVTWEIFEEELWARFGPTRCKDFDEALSKVRRVGSLRDYQKKFERSGNRVHGWTQKALVGTFMGGLKVEISDMLFRCSNHGLLKIGFILRFHPFSVFFLSDLIFILLSAIIFTLVNFKMIVFFFIHQH